MSMSRQIKRAARAQQQRRYDERQQQLIDAAIPHLKQQPIPAGGILTYLDVNPANLPSPSLVEGLPICAGTVTHLFHNDDGDVLLLPSGEGLPDPILFARRLGHFPTSGRSTAN